jgi:hypothetical protein
MVVRIVGVGIGVALLLFILFLRGLPVLFFLKMLPPLVLFLVAVAFIYAGVTSD